METTRTAQAAAAAKVAPAITPDSKVRSEVRREVRHDLRNAVGRAGTKTDTQVGYGLPCANCRLYYPANLDACPACNSTERVSPDEVAAIVTSQPPVEPVTDSALEQEREAFLKQFKNQLFAAHAEVANSTTPVPCAIGDHGETAEAATICKTCYDKLQERVDVCEAALHIDLKDAAQIVYDAVWADPSDPSKTYANAAGALLNELRKRAGVSSLLGPFQPLGN